MFMFEVKQGIAGQKRRLKMHLKLSGSLVWSKAAMDACAALPCISFGYESLLCSRKKLSAKKSPPAVPGLSWRGERHETQADSVKDQAKGCKLMP